MNTLHLKYALEVAKTGSITLAAQNLYMNQPNLSKAIKELETTIGIDIFKRTPKGIVPTPKGEEFLSYANNIMAQVDELETLYKTDKMKKISFSISVPRASYISNAYTHFVEKLDKSKDWELNFIETNSMKTISDVAEGQCNLGIIRYNKSHEGYFLDFLKDNKLTYESILEFEYLALMSVNNPLSLVNPITVKDLNRCVEIMHGDLTVPHLSNTELRKEARPQKRKIYVYERGSQFDLLSQITDSFMWVSPLPKVLLERYNLVQKSCSVSNQVFKDILIYPKGYQLSKIDLTFVNEINLVKSNIIKN